MLVSEFDRATPFGTGDIKTGCNYAAIHTKIDQVGAANFFGITKNGVYVPLYHHSYYPQ